MDIETRLRAHLSAQDRPTQFYAEFNPEGRPTIWVDGFQYIAVGNMMVPAKPEPQVAKPAGIDSAKLMGDPR